MIIVKISPASNGAHEWQSYHGVVHDGWALCREDASTLQNFPFGKVTAEEVDGVMVMTEWTPGETPKPVEPAPTPTLDERVTDLETALAESDAVAMSLYEASIAQDEINEEQDEAILGLYEMMGG